MSDAASGRLEHALYAALAVSLFFIARWALRRLIPSSRTSSPVSKRPRRAKIVFAVLIGMPLAMFVVLQVGHLFDANSEAPKKLVNVEDQMAASRSAPGWHVLSGELFDDGVRDKDGTRRMQAAIVEINARETEAGWKLDDWVRQRKEALDVGYQAEREGIYRGYERKGGQDGRSRNGS